MTAVKFLYSQTRGNRRRGMPCRATWGGTSVVRRQKGQKTWAKTFIVVSVGRNEGGG